MKTLKLLTPQNNLLLLLNVIVQGNVNIFVEKPIVSSLDECNSLLQLIKNKLSKSNYGWQLLSFF